MKNILYTPRIIKVILFLQLLNACMISPEEKHFQTQFDTKVNRIWIGPDFWANPLQDWKIEKGKIQCTVSDYNRNIILLTRELKEINGHVYLSTQLGILGTKALENNGWAGFRIGIRGRFNDYRDSAVHGWGINAGVSTHGYLFIKDLKENHFAAIKKDVIHALENGKARLDLNIEPSDDNIIIRLSLWSDGKKLDSLNVNDVKKDAIVGLVGLVSDFPRPSAGNEFEAYLQTNIGKNQHPSFWFSDWTIKGKSVKYHPEHAFGPILFAQHTLSEGIMKMTAQMPPISQTDSQFVHLEIQDSNGQWIYVTKTRIDPFSFTARFRVQDWNDKRDIKYRLFYRFSEDGQKVKTNWFEGIVRKDPDEKEEMVIAGFTGNNDLGFPNNEIVNALKVHNPDLLFFSGDQIYEGVGGYGHITEPLEKAYLDYLRKWYIFGWEYAELLRYIPSVSIPDDHDVYHGNLWGEAGKAAAKKGDRKDRQDSGGYTMPAQWVNMVERTQTSHLPDPYDPRAVKQGIGVYYTYMSYGGVSFAIIEDRKFKSAPKKLFPASAKVRNGWAENPEFNDPGNFNVPKAELLGSRQMNFLEDWIADWDNGVWMKVLLSQTIFSTVATLPDSAISDVVVPTLRIAEKDYYPQKDQPTQDMDSNGWPKTERDKVLRILRKGFALHIAGDQHLGSSIQYGIDSWGDAAFALCVPSVSNYFPRRWFPQSGPVDWKEGQPKNLGKFQDGFNNKMTVHAVANPWHTDLKPSFLYDRAAGYGIVKLDRKTREIEMANWPRQMDPSQPEAKPYEGWPVRFNQTDNYGRKAVAWLPKLNFMNIENPLIRVVEEKSNELIYTLRINGSAFSPKVFSNGLHTIHVAYQGRTKVIKDLQPFEVKDSEKLDIHL